MMMREKNIAGPTCFALSIRTFRRSDSVMAEGISRSVEIEVPTLRSRPEDIEPLVERTITLVVPSESGHFPVSILSHKLNRIHATRVEAFPVQHSRLAVREEPLCHISEDL